MLKNHSLLEKFKSKPKGGMISHWSEWPWSKNLRTTADITLLWKSTTSVQSSITCVHPSLAFFCSICINLVSKTFWPVPHHFCTYSFLVTRLAKSMGSGKIISMKSIYFLNKIFPTGQNSNLYLLKLPHI